MPLRTVVLGTACLLTLVACDGGGDPVQQALRETAAANHAAVTTEGVSPSPVPTEAEAAYAEVMIRQNREAITTASAVLAASQDPRIRRSARAVIDSRTREIAELQAWAPTAMADE